MFEFKVLSREDVASLLDMASAVESNLEVYRQRAEGLTDTWPTVLVATACACATGRPNGPWGSSRSV